MFGFGLLGFSSRQRNGVAIFLHRLSSSCFSLAFLTPPDSEMAPKNETPYAPVEMESPPGLAWIPSEAGEAEEKVQEQVQEVAEQVAELAAALPVAPVVQHNLNPTMYIRSN